MGVGVGFGVGCVKVEVRDCLAGVGNLWFLMAKNMMGVRSSVGK